MEAERIEDPVAAGVRVMTVHQSKGLEFDIVVLPELDLGLASGGGGDPLSYRPHPAGRVTRVFPYVGEATRGLFPDVPELHAAAEQAAAARWRDALSGLYVALTRARHAVHVLVKPDGTDGKGRPRVSTARTAARLVRCALGADGPAAEGETLFEIGDPRWYRAAGEDEAAHGPPRESGNGASATGPLVLRGSTRREKALGQVKPSALAGGSRVDLRSLLLLDRRAAEMGTLAHAWFEQIGWLEEGVPSDEELKRIAGKVTPALTGEQVDSLRLRFRTWLAAPEIRHLLSRNSYPAGATVEREVPFLHRADGRLVEGIIDRLVLLRERGRVVGAEILDYKTDAVSVGDASALQGKASHYRPQLDAYRAAVAAWYGLRAESIPARLLFLEAAAVVDVGVPAHPTRAPDLDAEGLGWEKPGPH